ncbi:MAG: metallophosphoesterase [Nitrosopumilaceae archaeon]
MDLVFSDIHADIDALNTILEVASSKEFTTKYGSFSRIINLGDVLERGNHPKEVLSKIKSLEKSHPVMSVMGNHDEAFLYKRPVSGSTLQSWAAHSKLTEEDLAFFSKNNDGTFGQQEFVDPKNNLFCVHGGPLDPKKITPKNAYDEAWLYQRSWQRLSEEDFEYFSYYGYHYTASSAFGEATNHFHNCIILCGHQHTEAAIIQNKEIKDIFSSLKVTQEKTLRFVLSKREIEIEPSCNYLIRFGLGGPSGYYGVGSPNPHFGIIQYNPKKATLFTVE